MRLFGLENIGFGIVSLFVLLLWLVIIGISIVVIVLLIKFLTKGIKAFDIYIEANNKGNE